MTAQIPDTFRYRNQKYDIIAMIDSIGFNPRSYGLQPHSSSTACWRGYWCEYAIENGKLILERLYMYNEDNYYPDLNGVSVLPREDEHGRPLGRFGHRIYVPHMEIYYTGKLILGNDFLPEFYIHMGFQRPWAFKELLEFDFVNGQLEKVIDHSDKAEFVRKKILDNPEEYDELLYSSMFGFVEDDFSLDEDEIANW